VRAPRLHLPSSEIYGGINGFWDYGPLGTELKQNLKALWWQRVVRERPDVEGIDSAIIAHPRTWEASGHVEHFSDPMVDCRACKKRFRADQLDDAPPCSARQGTSEHDFTEPRNFNLMLSTSDRCVGRGRDDRLSARRDVPADLQRLQARARGGPSDDPVRHRADRQGVPQRDQPAQLHVPLARVRAGRARVLRAPERAREVVRALAGRAARVPPRARLRRRSPAHAPHAQDELAHYARAAVDVEYLFPFGWQEIEGIHDRGDWDLSRHSQYSGKDLGITDPDTKEHYVPMVIETSVGVDRTCLALLCDAYTEEELGPDDTRVVMRFPAALAPVSVAVLPLSKKLAEPALALERELRPPLQRVLRRRRQHRTPLPPPGRGRHALLRDDRLRDGWRRQGDGARTRLDGPGADRARRRAARTWPSGWAARREQAQGRGAASTSSGTGAPTATRSSATCSAGRARTSPR
jgi:glycyl-tRNA synthetase